MTRSVRFSPFVRAGVFALAVGAPSVARAAEVPFAPPVTIAPGGVTVGRLVPADLDRDGDDDLMFTSASQNAVVFLRNVDGAGTSWSLTTVSTAVGTPRDLAAADVDGDGDPDIVSGSNYSTNALAW